MFGPEPVAMETTSLDRHPQCTSWQRGNWSLPAVLGEGNSLGSTASPGGVCKVRLTSGHFLKILSQTLGEEVSLLFPIVMAHSDSFVCLSLHRIHVLRALSTALLRHRVLHILVGALAHQAHLGSLGFSSQATALLTMLNFFAFFPSTRKCLVATYMLSEAQRFYPVVTNEVTPSLPSSATTHHPVALK